MDTCMHALKLERRKSGLRYKINQWLTSDSVSLSQIGSSSTTMTFVVVVQLWLLNVSIDITMAIAENSMHRTRVAAMSRPILLQVVLLVGNCRSLSIL